MKTFPTILTAVVIAVSVSVVLTQVRKPVPAKPDYQKLACQAGALDPECKQASNGAASQNSVQCGLDKSGHIVPDGKGGCIPPPPDGSIVALEFDMSHAIPICDRAVGASKTGKCIDSNGSEVDRSEYDRRPTHTGDPVPFCDKGADKYGQCWNANTRGIVNKSDYDRGHEIR